MTDQFAEVAVTGVPVGGRYSYRVPPHLAAPTEVSPLYKGRPDVPPPVDKAPPVDKGAPPDGGDK